jgi:predicted RNA-binding protein YlxR (DUF448 family)
VMVSSEGRVALDPKASKGGRGAWVHPTRTCIEAMTKRHAAERSLKVDVQRDLNAASLVASLSEVLLKKVGSLVTVAVRARALSFGAEAVSVSLERERVPLMLVAKDAGSVSSGLADEEKGQTTRVVRFGTKTELGKMLGRDEVALIALLDTRIAEELALTIDRLAALEDR